MTRALGLLGNDQVPLIPHNVEAAGRLLERAARDPTVSVLDTAPWDDDPVAPAEDSEVKGAEAERGITYETVRKELLG